MSSFPCLQPQINRVSMKNRPWETKDMPPFRTRVRSQVTLALSS
ncbi:hypothetical protein [Microseira wollei]|uniref:Uncharacterized protein n=1 Tax=Microseira wollei NIES-4236 TaxID=2530354 RepID=A0AAV3XQ79_9CYAN|nr:hypothetical protein [Microseira wollei]GET43046.1 hypothetical protein MiSe_78660 [Microseira wollei NIES-4236]